MLVEKTIGALSLVELLVRNNLNRNNDSSKRMNIKHYKFFFFSQTDDSEKYIMLDVAYEKNTYSKIISKKIESEKLGIYSDLMVWMPSKESILGDKLTVLGPGTTGISYDSQKELELMKQLYDVSQLFNEVEDMNQIRESFINIAERELEYRGYREYTYLDVLNDIEDFALVIIFKDDIQKLKVVREGLSKVKYYIFEKNFQMETGALSAASKVLYLVNLIRNKESKIEKYHKGINVIDVEEFTVPNKIKRSLKIIKKINEEAYYYIACAFKARFPL